MLAAAKPKEVKTFLSLNPEIGELELEYITLAGNPSVIYISNASLLSFLSRQTGKDKLFQSVLLEESKSSTLERPVWICKIQSDRLGDYSDVGEAAAIPGKSQDEQIYPRTLAQNKAKERAILFYLNIDRTYLGGCLIKGESEMPSNDLTSPSSESGKDFYTRKHLPFQREENHETIEADRPAIKESPKPEALPAQLGDCQIQALSQNNEIKKNATGAISDITVADFEKWSTERPPITGINAEKPIMEILRHIELKEGDYRSESMAITRYLRLTAENEYTKILKAVLLKRNLLGNCDSGVYVKM